MKPSTFYLKYGYRTRSSGWPPSGPPTPGLLQVDCAAFITVQYRLSCVFNQVRNASTA